MSRIRLAGSGGGDGTTIGLFHGALLLTGRKGFFEFPVDEEIAENPTRTPGDTVGPSLDTGGVLFIDEDTAAADEMAAFPVMGTTGDMVQDAGEAGFEEDQGIVGGRDVAREGRLEDSSRAVDHIEEGLFWMIQDFQTWGYKGKMDQG